MSLNYDAIRKATRDRTDAFSPSLAEAEAILTSSSTAAQGPTLTRNESVGRKTLVSRSEHWRPNVKRMLFSTGTDDSNRFAREQFRLLRVQLSGLRGPQSKVIAVGSAMSSEGKSFVAANLAHAFAALGEHRVLLVDFDLRRGQLASVLGAQAAPGVSEYLSGESSLADVLQAGFDDVLHFIPSGRLMQEPGELIGGSRVQELLVELRSLFDWIILDTPPAEYFSDAAVLAGLCDGVLLVTAANVTPIRFAKRLSERFRKESILGVVLNRVDRSEESNYYDHYYRQANLTEIT